MKKAREPVCLKNKSFSVHIERNKQSRLIERIGSGARLFLGDLRAQSGGDRTALNRSMEDNAITERSRVTDHVCGCLRSEIF